MSHNKSAEFINVGRRFSGKVNDLVKRNCTKCGFYSKEVEAKISYFSMFLHFGRADVALSGCKSFFGSCAKEEQEHALKLCNYQAVRGGTIELMDILKPDKFSFSVPDAFCYSLQMEKHLTERLMELKATAAVCGDDVTLDVVNELVKHQVTCSFQHISRMNYILFLIV